MARAGRATLYTATGFLFWLLFGGIAQAEGKPADVRDLPAAASEHASAASDKAGQAAEQTRGAAHEAAEAVMDAADATPPAPATGIQPADNVLQSLEIAKDEAVGSAGTEVDKLADKVEPATDLAPELTDPATANRTVHNGLDGDGAASPAASSTVDSLGPLDGAGESATVVGMTLPDASGAEFISVPDTPGTDSDLAGAAGFAAGQPATTDAPYGVPALLLAAMASPLTRATRSSSTRPDVSPD